MAHITLINSPNMFKGKGSIQHLVIDTLKQVAACGDWPLIIKYFGGKLLTKIRANISASARCYEIDVNNIYVNG